MKCHLISVTSTVCYRTGIATYLDCVEDYCCFVVMLSSRPLWIKLLKTNERMGVIGDKTISNKLCGRPPHYALPPAS